MDFEFLPVPWEAPGTEIPESLLKTGWLAERKPPAAYFNYKWRRDYLTALELQQKLKGLEIEHRADKKTIEEQFALKAPLDSPEFSGVPLAPTPGSEPGDYEIVNIAFLRGALSGMDFSGLLAKTKYIQNANLNSLTEDQAYICAGTLTNSPIPSTYLILRSYDTSSTSRILQNCWVPDLETNKVRSFVRSLTADGASVGNWQELATAAELESELSKMLVLIHENEFRNSATLTAMDKAIFTLFLETFKNLDDVNLSAGSGEVAITSVYNSDTHELIKTDSGTLEILSLPKIITGPNGSAWCLLDYETESGGIEFYISRDNGTTWSTLHDNTLTSIAAQPSGVQVVCKMILTGAITVKNLAWGVK